MIEHDFDEVTDAEVSAAVKAVPTHYAEDAFALINMLQILSPIVQTASGNVAMKNSGVCVVNKGTGAATTVTLPAHATRGMFAFVKDGKGDAATHNITVQPDGSTHNTTIDGAASHLIDTPYGAALYMHDGTEWSLISYLCQTVAGLPIETAADSLTALSGGAQAGATLCAFGINRFATVAAANDSAQLPLAAPGLAITVINASGSHAMQVFANAGGSDTINGTTGSTGISLGAGKTATFYSASTGTWHYTVSA